MPLLVLLGAGLSVIALSIVILTMNRSVSRPGPEQAPAPKVRLGSSPQNPK